MNVNKHNLQELRLGWLCPCANEKRQSGKKWAAKDNLCKFGASSPFVITSPSSFARGWACQHKPQAKKSRIKDLKFKKKKKQKKKKNHFCKKYK